MAELKFILRPPDFMSLVEMLGRRAGKLLLILQKPPQTAPPPGSPPWNSPLLGVSCFESHRGNWPFPTLVSLFTGLSPILGCGHLYLCPISYPFVQLGGLMVRQGLWVWTYFSVTHSGLVVMWPGQVIPPYSASVFMTVKSGLLYHL